MAVLKGVPVKDVCRAATWSSDYVFAKFYRLDVVRPGTSFSSQVWSAAPPRRKDV